MQYTLKKETCYGWGGWCRELLSDGKRNMRLVRLVSGLALESNRFRAPPRGRGPGRDLLSMSWRANGAVSCNLSPPHDSDAKCLSVCHGRTCSHPLPSPASQTLGQFNYSRRQRRRRRHRFGFKVTGARSLLGNALEPKSGAASETSGTCVYLVIKFKWDNFVAGASFPRHKEISVAKSHLR